MTTATVPNTTALRRSLTLVATHIDAGHADPHHPKYPKYVKDLGSLITNARRAGDKTDLPHSSEREKLSYLVRNASTHEEIGDIMGRLDAINTAIGDISTAQNATADEIAKIAAQLAAGNVSDAELDAVADQLNAIADKQRGQAADVDALVDVAGEDDEPPVEPTP